jgi:hypothetical protein
MSKPIHGLSLRTPGGSRVLICIAMTAGCMVGHLVVGSVVLAATITTTVSPAAYRTTRAGDGGQPVGNLMLQDQRGRQDDAGKYVSFTTATGSRYKGYRKYFLPKSIQPTAVITLQVKANYRGAAVGTQVWTWKLYNWKNRSWVRLGDTGGARQGVWKLLRFKLAGAASDFIRASNRELRVSLESNNARDDCALDFETMVVTSNADGIWIPAQRGSWQWQLSDLPVDQSIDAEIFDIDLFDNNTSAVASLHARGRKVICYLSAGSWENWRPDAGAFPAAVKGKPLEGWAGESWLDIRQIDVLGPIMEARMDLCKSKGFDAVEVDNIDGYANDSGFRLTFQDQLNYNLFLANAAHARGLSIGLKNDLDQVKALLPYFDWALNEECFQYDECSLLRPFIKAGKAVFNVEYQLKTSQFCDEANAMNFNSMRKHLDLDAWRAPCR